MTQDLGRKPYRGTDTRVHFDGWDIPIVAPTFEVWNITEAAKYENEELDIHSIKGQGVMIEEDGEWFEVKRAQYQKTKTSLKTGLTYVVYFGPFGDPDANPPRPSNGRSRQRNYPHTSSSWLKDESWLSEESRFRYKFYRDQTGGEPMTDFMTHEQEERTRNLFEEKPEEKPKRSTPRPKGKPTEQEARDQAKADKDRLRNLKKPSPPVFPETLITKTTRVMWQDSNGVWTDVQGSTGTNS